MLVVFCFLQIQLLFCAQIYTRANTSFTSSGQIVTNLVYNKSSSTNTTTVIPYQYIIDDDSGSLVSAFDHGVCTYPCGQISASLIDYYFRVDNRVPFYLNIDFDLTNGGTVIGYIVVVFEPQPSQRYSSIVIDHSLKSYSYAATPVRYRFNSVFNISTSGQTIKLYRLGASTSFHGQIDISDICKRLVLGNYINKTYYIQSIVASFRVGGSGSIKQKVECVSSTISYLRQTNITIGEWTVFNHLFNQDLTSLDYSNLSVSANASDISSMSSNFYYTTSFRLNAYQFVAVGWMNNTWITDIGEYSLPVSVESSPSINGSYVFTEEDVLASKKSACFVILLRDDYNPERDTFDSVSTFPSTEIYVCQWSNIPVSGSTIRIITDDNTEYNMYEGTSSSKDLKNTWPTFTFIPLSNITTTINLSLLQFCLFAANIYPNIIEQYIVGLQAGFRFYTGKGSFSLDFVDFSVNKKVFTCAASATFSSCSADSLVQKALQNLLSAPNLGLVVKMILMIRLIDDATYYVYHKTQYDNFFSHLSRLSWNLTNAKLIIPQLNEFYNKFDISYSKNFPLFHQQKTPKTYINLEQNANFLKQTQSFWIGFVPQCLITFALIYCLKKIIDKFRIFKTISIILRKFQTFWFLPVALLSDSNLQYLSFRCFSQIYQTQIDNSIQLISLVVSYIMLFVILFYGTTSYLLLPEFLKKHSYLLLEGYTPGYRAIFHSTVLSLLRVFQGMIHSLLYGRTLQIECLVFIQFFYLVILINNRRIYKRKILFTCHLFDAILHLLAHCVFTFEVIISNNNGYESRSNRIWRKMEKFSEGFFDMLVILCIADIILDFSIRQNYGPAMQNVNIIHKLNKLERLKNQLVSKKNQATESQSQIKVLQFANNIRRIDISQMRLKFKRIRKDRLKVSKFSFSKNQSQVRLSHSSHPIFNEFVNKQSR